jgi:tRNA threonylcarbamoyladenosine biosynthesis protein TsaB
VPSPKKFAAPILAIETATRTLSVALLRGERLLAELVEGASASAAETLLPAVDHVLERAGVHLQEVGGFAVSIGPGSFTGLRVGLATVKGLAFDPPRPVAPVSTLAALAAGAGPRPEPIAALLDARRGEVYAAVYPPDPERGTPLLREGLFHPEDLAERLPTPCSLVGDGVAVAAAVLEQRCAGRLHRLPEALDAPRAFHVGRIGARVLASRGGISADQVVPRYLRRAEAEVRREAARRELEARHRAL